MSRMPNFPIAVVTVRKNGLEEIPITLTEFHEVPLVDVRTFAEFGSNTERKATKKGVSLRIASLPELGQALERSEDEARRLGLLQPEEASR